MKLNQHSTQNFLLSLSLVFSSLTHLFSQTTVTYQNLHTQTTFDAKTVDTNKPVGSIGAAVDVSGGTASYTIPIQIPAGTNSVQPNISITYQSQGGDGLLGRGWGITGLSMITRNIKSFYHDGYVGPATIDANDRFAIDGVRLIATGTGAYGANNTTYSKEMEDFSRVTSYGTSGTGPTYFILETKEGVEYEYGNSADSRFLASNNTDVLFWRLNKVKYKDGNYIEYVYDNADNESKISEIRYTGNNTVNPPLAPYNKITFEYKLRNTNDQFQTITYEGDKSIKLKSLLTKIDISSENNLVKRYELKYANDLINVYLNEVIEFGSDGTTSFNSTIFKYGDTPVNSTKVNFISSSSNPTDHLVGDFNGDGYTDLVIANRQVIDNDVYHTSFELYTKLPNPANEVFNLKYTKTLPLKGKVANNFSGYNFFVSDFNGDGNDDLGYAFVSNNVYPLSFQYMRLYLNNSDASNATEFDISLPQPTDFFFVAPDKKFLNVGDFNGDGIKDIVIILCPYKPTPPFWIDDSRVYIWYGGSGAASFTVLGHTGSPSFTLDKWQARNCNVLDFNGDGRDEIMITRGSYSEIFEINGLFANSIKYAGFPTEWHLMFFGDYNGDRKTDILVRTSLNDNNANWNTAYSTGKNWVENSFTFVGVNANINEYYSGDKISIADFNGDGKSDIVRSATINNLYFLHTYYSYGKSFLYTSQSQTTSITSINNVIGDFNGDGKSDFVNRPSLTAASSLFYMKKEGEEFNLQKIKNGENHVTTINYERLTKIGPHYSKTGVTPYPFNTIRTPLYVPTTLTKEGLNFKKFEYEDAILHRGGKGFLGFKKIQETSGYSNVLSIKEYELNTTHVLLPLKKIINKFTNVGIQPINERTITNEFVQQNSGTLQKIIWHKIPTVNDENVTEGTSKVATNITYDGDGNVTSSSLVVNKKVGTTYTPIETTNITSTFIIKGSFRKNVPETVTTSNTRLTEVAFSQTVKYEYNLLGQTTKKTEFFGQPKALIHTYTYTNLGNIETITLSSTGLTNRATTSTYDTKGRFVNTSINALNQTSTATFDGKWAKPLLTIGVDGLKTKYEYDIFGRLKKTTYYKDLTDAYDVNTNYVWSVVSGTSYYVETVHPGKPDVKAYYDKLGRNVQTETEGFGGLWITDKKSYDLFNRIETTTGPYRTAISGETGLVTTTTYDTYNRVSSVSNNFKTINYAYAYNNGEATTTTTIANVTPIQSTSVKTDASGKTVSTTDNGGTLTYEYYSNGNTKAIKNGTTTYSSMNYDIYARQTHLIDINAGTTTYEYNAYGELIKENSPSGNDLNFMYNQLGQVTHRTHKEAGITKTTIYTYYTTGVTKNKLYTITNFANSYTETYTYDPTYGRLTSKAEFVDAPNTINYTYNKYDDVLSITYPSTVVINYAYDANGFINTIKNGTTTLFTNQSMTPYGNYKAYTYGNGLAADMTYHYTFPTKYLVQKITPTETIKAQDLEMVWDYKTGNLSLRKDLKSTTPIIENFLYDNLNRLTNAQVGSNTALTTNYFTDANGNSNGNLTIKSDAAGAGGLEYLLNPKINAVNKIVNPVNISLAQQNITFATYQRPTLISENGKSIDLFYGADYERRKAIFKTGTTITETRYYFGSYEKQVIGAITRHIHYVSNGERLISIIVKENTNTSLNYYTVTDHLGSIVAVTNPTVTTLANCFQAQQNFDPWGRKRNIIDWTYNGTQSVPVWLYRGFTGHEHYPEFVLINMNARLYDPIVGRMLSPDIAVTMPYSSQGYNRYSYANNNPLKYTDPSGNEPITTILIAIGIAVTTNGISNVINDRGFFDNWLRAAVIGAVTGGISAGIGAVASNMAAGQIYVYTKLEVAIAQAVMHSWTSAMVSLAQKGDVKSGFASGLFSSLTSSTIQLTNGGDGLTIIGGGVSGGFGAAITGGSFYEGFTYGLISGALNHVAHNIFEKQLQALRDVTIEVTDIEVGSTKLNGYNSTSGRDKDVYEVPTYRMTVSGTDGNGNVQTYNFEVVRFGVKTISSTKTAYIQGAPSGSYTIDYYNPNYLDNTGSFHITGNYLLHVGSRSGVLMGNNGCISVIGGNRSWNLFKQYLVSLTGTNSYQSMANQGLLNINILSAQKPPLLKL